MRYFCEVYRRMSISDTARQLHTAQSTITIAIQRLERELGFPLFIRLHQRLYPTAHGAALYEKLCPFLYSMDRLEHDMHNFGSKKTIILARNIQSSALLLEAINRFRIRYPDITVGGVTSSSSQSSDLLRQNKVDLAFGSLEYINPKEEEARLFIEEEQQYCTNPDNPLSCRHSIRVTDIADRPLAVMNHGFDRHSQIRKNFERAHIKPNIILYAKGLHSLIELAKKGIADTFLLSRVIKSNPPLCGVPLLPARYMHMGFWWRKDHRLTEAEYLLMDFIYGELNGEHQ